MSERKVLNKYFPPDFDPALIPRLRLGRERQYKVRLMAPFSMRCETCGHWIGAHTKFNARKETVVNEKFHNMEIYRFYIRCPTCAAEITFKTDPENLDYVCEKGASRNFEPTRNSAQERVGIDKALENLADDSVKIQDDFIKIQQEQDEIIIKTLFKDADGQRVKRLRDAEDAQISNNIKFSQLDTQLNNTNYLQSKPNTKNPTNNILNKLGVILKPVQLNKNNISPGITSSQTNQPMKPKLDTIVENMFDGYSSSSE
ncbi:hypothetical protein BB561_003104 [Smittium simulii]|uniref:Splicing factor YJU2 n=1 Tax=Smittium simulii TaxID=133385 RepID=A0A2T9YMW3_9FUNG|nr:hypothetical protein BB561_003104 [Smittium simulii]